MRAAACAALVTLGTSAVHAQLPRRSASAGDGPVAPRGGATHPRFPYAGLWAGTRTMPAGSDQVSFRFAVSAGKHYAGVTIHPDGSQAPQSNLAASARGLTWEQPNSGGGTWVYAVRLVSPDTMEGTLVLRDVPANFPNTPRGTLVLTRQPSDGARTK